MLVLASAVLLGGLAGTSHAGLFGTDETPGERFRKAMEKIRLSCEGRKLAPGEMCGEVAKLKPADPLATEEGRFAHSITIPNPLPEDSGYKPGMTSQEYFDHLCKIEAGEFIYKTVENVEGLYMMRPRELVNDSKLQHLYALEDPYAYSDLETDAPQKLFINPPWGRYTFFEIRQTVPGSSLNTAPRYLRYSGYAQNRRPMVVEEVSMIKSRYGYIWRGVPRPHDRELGIAGGEIIVLDLMSNDVLAVRRGYMRSGDVRNNVTGVWWVGGHACPAYKHANQYTYEFLSRVIKPAPVGGSEQGGFGVAK